MQGASFGLFLIVPFLGGDELSAQVENCRNALRMGKFEQAHFFLCILTSLVLFSRPAEAVGVVYLVSAIG